MTYFLAALAGALGAGIGGALFAGLGMLAGSALRISNFEGARGVFAVWLFGPVGAILGLCLGLYLVFRYHGGHSGFGDIAWRGAVVVGALVALAGAGVLIRLATLPNLAQNASPPQLHFEIRMPAATPLPAERHRIKIELHTPDTSHDALLTDDSPRADGAAKIVAGFVQMYRRTSSRTVVLRLADGRDVPFVPSIRATPRHQAELGPWEPARQIYEKGAERARPPRPEENFEIRYRADWPDRS